MTEYRISDDFRKDGLDKADATPNPGVDLGALNTRNLKRQGRKVLGEVRYNERRSMERGLEITDVDFS